MTDRAQQAADAVAAVAGLTPAVARRTLNEYAVRDQAAALAVAGGGSQPANVPTLQYLEWTPGDPLTQSTDLVAGTQVIAAWTVTDEAFETVVATATLTVGTDPGAADALLNGADVTLLGQIWTVADLSGGSTPIGGIQAGFPFSTDKATIFPSGGSLTGTLDPDGATTGRVRLYFLACIPAEAT